MEGAEEGGRLVCNVEGLFQTGHSRRRCAQVSKGPPHAVQAEVSMNSDVKRWALRWVVLLHSLEIADEALWGTEEEE